MSSTTLTYVEGTSSKFYTLTIDGTELKIHFGRIGTNGQTQLKSFKDAAAAQKEYDALLKQKKAKGYVEDGSNGGSNGSSKKRKDATPAPTAEEAPAEEAPAKAKGKSAAKAPSAKATAKPAKTAAPLLPAPSLGEPEVEGLDLVAWRPGPLPVPEADKTPFSEGDGKLVIEGYTITFGDDGELLVADAKGKRLKNPPPKLRKHEEYQALMRGRKDDRSRGKRAKRVLEELLISGTPLQGEELAWLLQDAAYAPLLTGLIVRRAGGDGEPGVLLACDAAKGIGLLPLDYDARWVGTPEVEITHPTKLGDLTAWQDLLVDLGLQQGLVQAFREVRTVPAAHRALTESGMLAGREARSAAVFERVLMEEGWVVRRGMAKRKLALRNPDGTVSSADAWFDYGEYYMPSDPTTSGVFGFYKSGTKSPLKFQDVPSVLVSEAIRSLELCLAQAGAKKDEDEEEETEGEEGEGGAGEGGESSDDDDD